MRGHAVAHGAEAGEEEGGVGVRHGDQVVEKSEGRDKLKLD